MLLDARVFPICGEYGKSVGHRLGRVFVADLGAHSRLAHRAHALD
jgi:hypothetical protein